MVSALVSMSNSLGSSSSLGHCVVFLGKALYSHSTSLHPGVSVGARKFNAGGNSVLDRHPIERGVEILLVPSRYRNWDKLRPDEPLWLVCRLYQPTCVYSQQETEYTFSCFCRVKFITSDS